MVASFWNWFDALEWYWKALLILFFWWIIFPLYAWTRSEWSNAAKWTVTAIVAVLFIAVASTATSPPADQQRQRESPRAVRTDRSKAKKSAATSRTESTTSAKSAAQGTSGQGAGQPQGEMAIVTRVIDGDTINVRFADGHTARVRYIGIDTWETWDQPHGGHGTDANRGLVEGRQVRLVRDVSDRDRYNRLLRYVYVGDVFVNAWLVQEGHARAKDYPPDSAHATEFAELQRKAEAQGIACFYVARQQPTVSSPPPPPPDLIGNRNSGKLHNLAHGACQNYVNMMNESNKVPFSSEAAANAAGFYACLKC